MELFKAPQTWPFMIALGLVVVLSALQALALLLGGHVGVGEVDLHADVDLHTDIDVHGGFDSGIWVEALDWLGVGKLPLSILLTLWAGGFGLAGLTVQAIAKSSGGAFLPALPASGIALLLSLPILHLGGLTLRPIFQKDDTEAVAIETLLGSEGEIVVGRARRGHPTQARVRDKWGTSHYVLVEPENDDESFEVGSRVLLLKRHAHIFRVIAGANVRLED